MTSCPQCDQENRPGNRFCTFCGTNLVDLPPQTANLQLTWGMGNQDFSVSKQEYSVGRDETNDFILFDPEVSGQHFKVTWKGSAYWIQDLESRNGTFVNGERLTTERKLERGDLIRLGRSMLTFTI